MKTIPGNIYDYPKYYDLIFGSDWKAEVSFLNDCFEKHVSGKCQRLFEPACGTGRLLYRMAKEGFEVSGLDLNPKAIEFCNQRLKRHGFESTGFVGDMTDFETKRKADASFNTINSFRHLGTEKQARDHLQCMAQTLRKGGIYVLGLHLTPTIGPASEEEAWSARRGNLQVNTMMWLVERDLKKRFEMYGMSYDVYTPTESYRIEDRIRFRTYTLAQMKKLIGSVPDLALAEVYDFAYDIDAPIELDSRTEDVVLILKKI